MSDQRIDPERRRSADPFDQPDGYSGQDYAREREEAEGRLSRRPAPSAAAADTGDADLPPDNGQRAWIDPATGEVHGSGMSDGGGQPGEDFSSDAATGDGYPLTGGEGESGAPGPLGPENDKASYI